MEKQQDLPLPSETVAPQTEASSSWWQARRFGLGVALGAMLLDVMSKLAILSVMKSLPVAVVPGVFSFVFAWNRGVSFSFLADADHPLHVFGFVVPSDLWLPLLWSAVAVVAISMFIWWLGYEAHRYAQWGLGLIIGGAAGNLIDRIVHGAVVDFLLVYWHPWYFPAFNVADTCITCGVGLLILDALRQNREDKKKGTVNRDHA